MKCAFCDTQIFKDQVYFETINELVLYNRIPILPGHSLVIPKQHLPTLNDLTSAQRVSLFNTVNKVSKMLKVVYKTNGINVAWNEGEVAGQTIPHLHIHLLPRQLKDMTPDPRNLYYRTEKNRLKIAEKDLNSIVKKLNKSFSN